MRPHAPRLHKKNGIVERKNHHILETARALLLGAHVPNWYLGDVVAILSISLIACLLKFLGSRLR
jgi:hypothetical protein